MQLKGMSMDMFDGLDWGTYYFFRFQANQAPALAQFMQVGSWLGSYVGDLIILVLALAATPPLWRRRMALVVVAGFLAGEAIVEGVKAATQRPRPPDAQNILGSNDTSSSFPNRAVFLAAFGCLMAALALERRSAHSRWRVGFYVVAALVIIFVCVSELWLGLAFVTDILAALAGGIGLALIARWAATQPHVP